jgi:hypothetical protein
LDIKIPLCPLSGCRPISTTKPADQLLLKFIRLLQAVIVKWRVCKTVGSKRHHRQLILDLKLVYGNGMWQIFAFLGNFLYNVK